MGPELMTPGSYACPAFEINVALATTATALQCLGASAAAAKAGTIRVDWTDQVLADRARAVLVTCRAIVVVRAAKESEEIHKRLMVGWW